MAHITQSGLWITSTISALPNLSKASFVAYGSPGGFSTIKSDEASVPVLQNYAVSRHSDIISSAAEALAFFFRMLAQSYAPNIYIPTPIPLLYNPFTIVLHKRPSAYLFRAAHTPAWWIRTKQNKDFHPTTPQPIRNQDYWPNPSRKRI